MDTKKKKKHGGARNGAGRPAGGAIVRTAKAPLTAQAVDDLARFKARFRIASDAAAIRHALHLAVEFPKVTRKGGAS